MFETVCAQLPACRPDVLEALLELAVAIAREGREGRRIGTLFTLGKAEAVLAASRALILDPLAGHAPAHTRITEKNLRGTLKELAQLDGAFVVSESAVVRVFGRGRLVATVIPELWLLSRQQARMRGSLETERFQDLAVLLTPEPDNS
ncbi:MAG: diadenylate cyclase [Acidobacteria bacterium]|nr:diadenylate cyclase [Acidobacteriota bacterium]